MLANKILVVAFLALLAGATVGLPGNTTAPSPALALLAGKAVGLPAGAGDPLHLRFLDARRRCSQVVRPMEAAWTHARATQIAPPIAPATAAAPQVSVSLHKSKTSSRSAPLSFA